MNQGLFISWRRGWDSNPRTGYEPVTRFRVERVTAGLRYLSAAALGLSDVFLYASIVVFGLIVWSIPTIMSAAVGDYMGPDQAVKAFGFITLFFGAGQIVGPALAGYLADSTGNFSMAFWLCALLTATAVVLAGGLRQPKGE